LLDPFEVQGFHDFSWRWNLDQIRRLKAPFSLELKLTRIRSIHEKNFHWNAILVTSEPRIIRISWISGRDDTEVRRIAHDVSKSPSSCRATGRVIASRLP
jgi:hypothetical protein